MLRNTSTANAGHRTLASWLDFESPGSSLKKEKRGSLTRITKQIWAESTELLSATVSNWGPELGLELSYGFDFGLGIYAGVGAVVHGSVQSGEAEVLSTKLPVVTDGLSWNFGE